MRVSINKDSRIPTRSALKLEKHTNFYFRLFLERKKTTLYRKLYALNLVRMIKHIPKISLIFSISCVMNIDSIKFCMKLGAKADFFYNLMYIYRIQQVSLVHLHVLKKSSLCISSYK